MLSVWFYCVSRAVLSVLCNYNLTHLVQMEHLKACAEIATQRTINWQKFCMKDDCKLCKMSLVTVNKLLMSVIITMLCLFFLFSAQLSYTSYSRLVSWWTRVFRQCFCNCSPAPSVAVKCWPAPPLHHSQEEALVVLDRQEGHSPLRASLLVRKAKRRTKRKIKRVSKLLSFYV